MSYNPEFDAAGQASLGVGTLQSSQLMSLLESDDIVPGSPPSYSICKTIYAYHPLGAKMVEKPIDMAQSQTREIEIPNSPEDELIEAFNREWRKTGSVGADTLIKNVVATSRIYGIASVLAVCPEIPADDPLPLDKLHELDIHYNILDPLNTAGSLVLDQDPNAEDFQKPKFLSVGGKSYHPSRAAILLNETPIYIEWTNSAFGFVGRSVYQRALYPLKSYVQSMITDALVTEKAGLLVANLKSPGAIVDQRTRNFFGFKRNQIKGAKTGNVLSIGIDEKLESLDLKNVREAAEFARNNILKNIASACNMPASMINDETLAEGFGEGSEDAKQIARFIDGLRIDMAPIYRWFDNIVMHRAWNPEFYAALQNKYPDLRDVDYKTSFYRWKNSFRATWPNLLEEPDSEKVKVDDVVCKAAIACFEVLEPTLDPENRARAVMWLADVMNDRDFLFSEPLNLDEEAIASYTPASPAGEPNPIPESYET